MQPQLPRPRTPRHEAPRPAHPRLPLALALPIALLAGSHIAPANSAAEVIQYLPGTGTPAGYDLTASVLGEPSRVTPGDFGGPVDPFSPPWQSGQLLSIGAGGSLTIRFAHPVLNHPDNPFGLDFLVFGSAGFLITNGDFSGGGITDGSLFGASEGDTRISVSLDGATYFVLDPALAPRADGLFPTDGAGDFSRPVNPALTGTAFNGLALTGIRVAYDGSGGGTGYDINWARDDSGNPAGLDAIQFVRVDVLGDRADLDAFMAVPEPGAWPLLVAGGLLLAGMPRRPSPRP